MLSIGMSAGRSVGPSVAAGMSPRLYLQAARPAADAGAVIWVSRWLPAQGVSAAPAGARSASPEAQAIPASALAPPGLDEQAAAARAAPAARLVAASVRRGRRFF